MRKIFILVVACAGLLFSLSSLVNPPEEDKLVGIWAEYWEEDTLDPMSTSGIGVDTLEISLDKTGHYKMRCINDSHYIYDKIIFLNNILSFRMENTVDPSERFYINYTMKYVGASELNGSIVNSKGETNNVRMVKLK